MESVDIDADVCVHEYTLNDLSESQRDDRKIVALKFEDRNADQKAEHRCQYRSADDRKDQSGNPGSNTACQYTGHTDSAESADTHKSGLSKIELARYADIEIEADGSHNIACDRYQETGEHTSQISALYKDFNDYIGNDHKSEGNDPPSVLFVSKAGENAALFFHVLFPPLNLDVDLLAEQAGRLDQKDYDQDTEYYGVRKLC